MRKKDYKGRCMKKTSPKSETVCRLYDDLQISFLKNLEADDDVISIQTNAPLDDLDFTSDFLCRRANGDFMLRECVYRKQSLFPEIKNRLVIRNGKYTYKELSSADDAELIYIDK